MNQLFINYSFLYGNYILNTLYAFILNNPNLIYLITILNISLILNHINIFPRLFLNSVFKSIRKSNACTVTVISN
jgi:hypothetical protein